MIRLAGAALAMPQIGTGLRAGPWARIGLGLLVSVLLGALLGWLTALVLKKTGLDENTCRRAQVASAGAMALMHGAQDGQKFLGVLLLAVSLNGNGAALTLTAGPRAACVVCALCMALGTALGGRRIVDMVGCRLVTLSPRTGFAADLAGTATLLLCSLSGLPVSTTHTQTAAILGAGSAGHARPDWTAVRSVLWAWLFTFPGCGVLGYFATQLLVQLA